MNTKHDHDQDGVYHCLLHGLSTRVKEEIQEHIKKQHRGRFVDVGPEDFFYPEGESYRAYCTHASRGRQPGCDWQRYLTDRDEAERLAERHSGSCSNASRGHQAEVELFGGKTNAE